MTVEPRTGKGTQNEHEYAPIYGGGFTLPSERALSKQSKCPQCIRTNHQRDLRGHDGRRGHQHSQLRARLDGSRRGLLSASPHRAHGGRRRRGRPSPVQEPGGGRGGGKGSRGEPIVSAGCTLRQIKSRLGRWCIGLTERDVASGYGPNDIHHLVCDGDQMECCTITKENKRGHCYQLGGQ